MSLISISNLTFSYEGSYDNIFENVSFQFDTDWKLGFTGRNGRGKTTFLNLLLGKYEYGGTISASVEFDYFPFAVPDPAQETWQAAQGLNPACELWRLERELNLLEVEGDALYRPFHTLSQGERTKVLLAVLFLRENSFLLIDEPTNHLDIEARQVLGQYLKRKKGFLLVSHDRQLLDDCVDHILTINRSSIEIQKGNFSSWYENKTRQDQYELAENERLKKDIRRLQAAARQSHDWADRVESVKIGFNPKQKAEQWREGRDYIGEQSRRMQQRRKNLERRQQNAIEEKSALLKNLETADELKLFPQSHHKTELVQCGELALSYGEKNVCRAFDLTVRQGERIALRGRNGCGKSSVLKAILAAAGVKLPGPPTVCGELLVASGLKISYVSQDTSALSGPLDAYAAACGVEERLLKALLRKLDFSRVQFEKPMEAYSEGQKKKVLLARSLCEQAHLYIWDEPLNYVDVLSRIQIEELILRYEPTLLFVEHDAAFTEKIATRVAEL